MTPFSNKQKPQKTNNAVALAIFFSKQKKSPANELFSASAEGNQ